MYKKICLMKANLISKVICLLLIIAILVSGCASSTLLQTTPTNASVHVKGQIIGTTPYTYSDRKMAGSSTLITLKKEGYEDYYTTLRRVERFNPVALLGIVFVWPLLWVIGYDQVHSYELEKAEEITQAMPDPEVEKTKDVAQTIPDYDLVISETPVQNLKVERLLSQGKVENAIDFSENQDGSYQSDCFFTIAEFYLDKDNYSTAEDFYKKSGKTKVGYINIAEHLMRGEVVDSTLVMDENKIKTYLRKVYNYEKDVHAHMAVCSEKYAKETKERIELNQSMKDMGIMSMSKDGRSVNIENNLILSKIQATLYFNSAVQYYEELDNVMKVEQLKDDIKVLNIELPILQTPSDSNLEKTKEVAQTISDPELEKPNDATQTISDNKNKKADNIAKTVSKKKNPNSLFPEGTEKITLLSATISPESITTKGSTVTVNFKNIESISTEKLIPVVVFVATSMTITTRNYSGHIFNSNNLIFNVANPQRGYSPNSYGTFSDGQLSGSGTIYIYLEDLGDNTNKEDKKRVSNVLSVYATFR